MLELTTINTTELTNKKLGTQLNNIKKQLTPAIISSGRLQMLLQLSLMMNFLLMISKQKAN